jgi:hypothetical protein
MDKEQILRQREIWYNTIEVQYELCKLLHHRELAIITAKTEKQRFTTRYIICLNKEYMQKHFQRFYFYEIPRNLYHSVATLNYIPVFSYNLKTRSHTPEYQEFNKNFNQKITGYNFFLDFDSDEDFSKALIELKKAKKIFDDYKLPYYILNSSKKGFHLQIPSQFMPFEMGIDKLLETINKVAYNLKGIFELSCIDLSIFDSKRVCKLPYSYSCEGECICLPLSDEQLDNFSFDLVSMEYILNNIKIRDRGLIIRHLELGEEQLKKNVAKFFSDYI